MLDKNDVGFGRRAIRMAVKMDPDGGPHGLGVNLGVPPEDNWGWRWWLHPSGRVVRVRQGGDLDQIPEDVGEITLDLQGAIFLARMITGDWGEDYNF